MVTSSSDAPYQAMSDNRIKHMEMVQAVIARLGANGFLVKGWTITVAGAFSGFALSTNSPSLAFTGGATTAVFWALDTYFLRAERLFRALFDQVRKHDAEVEPFFMGATGESFVTRVREGKTASDNSVGSWVRTALRPTLSIFYGALITASLFVGIQSREAKETPDPKPTERVALVLRTR